MRSQAAIAVLPLCATSAIMHSQLTPDSLVHFSQRSLGEQALDTDDCVDRNTDTIPTLLCLCLRSLESTLGNGRATFSLQDLPLGLLERIYDFIFSEGSRMAQMEVSRALAGVLSQRVTSLDFGYRRIDSLSSRGGRLLGDSALLELASGCNQGLVHLDINACRFVTDAGVLGVLIRCPALRSISMSGCGLISDQTAANLSRRTPGLTKLNLGGLGAVSDGGLAHISGLPSLEHLNLARCNVGDETLIALGNGPCRNSLRWLDLTGTKVSHAGTSSLRNIQFLEFLVLSSTCIPVTEVAAIARDLRMPAALPQAPKTVARCSRTLLIGSKWSEQQLRHAPQRADVRTRRTGVSLGSEHGTSRRGWTEGPSKAMRFMRAASARAERTRLAGSPDDLVKVGFCGNEPDESEKRLLTNLVLNIVKLWPAVPVR